MAQPSRRLEWALEPDADLARGGKPIAYTALRRSETADGPGMAGRQPRRTASLHPP